VDSSGLNRWVHWTGASPTVYFLSLRQSPVESTGLRWGTVKYSQVVQKFQNTESECWNEKCNNGSSRWNCCWHKGIYICSIWLIFLIFFKNFSIVLMTIAHQIWQITKVAHFVKYMKMNLEIDTMLETVEPLWLLQLWHVKLIKPFGRSINSTTQLEV